LERCRSIIADCAQFGGVLTLNWHDRSLAPERNWDEFYRTLLGELDACKPWFAQARQAVAWFRLRRAVRFESATMCENRIVVRARVAAEDATADAGSLPTLCLRVLLPSDAHDEGTSRLGRTIEFDISGNECSTTIDISLATA
jgi:hypothetical protein